MKDKNLISYEWSVGVWEDGDFIGYRDQLGLDCDLGVFKNNLPLKVDEDICLIVEVCNSKGDLIDRGIALVTCYRLPNKFDIGLGVPDQYKREVLNAFK